MTLYLWIFFVAFVFVSVIPLFFPKRRTKWKIIQAFLVTISAILAIVAIEILFIPPLLPIFFVILVSIFTDKSTYTKTGLVVGGVVLIILLAGGYYLFHDDPEYVENYIENHPDLASMFVSVNGEIVINQGGDVKRPLASVVKTLIAIEYANQVVEGKVDPEELIPLAELEKFYLPNTDGGAHPAWLEEMEASDLIENDRIPLHEIAKGMMMFSSNANTDFLIEKLGAESINRVIATLDLQQHDPIYPLVAPLLASEYLNYQHGGSLSTDELVEKLQSMTLEEYRELAWTIHKQLKEGEADFYSEPVSVPMDLQKVWSDRLPNATAEDYGKVMSAISNQTATLPGGEEILRDCMEWPMRLHASNREMYAHFGAKGGSTAFVLNQALYVEDHDGKKIEVIIFTEGFSIIEQIKMNQNMNSFLIKVLSEFSRL